MSKNVEDLWDVPVEKRGLWESLLKKADKAMALAYFFGITGLIETGLAGSILINLATKSAILEKTNLEINILGFGLLAIGAASIINAGKSFYDHIRYTNKADKLQNN
jgi:hypothetical protein